MQKYNIISLNRLNLVVTKPIPCNVFPIGAHFIAEVDKAGVIAIGGSAEGAMMKLIEYIATNYDAAWHNDEMYGGGGDVAKLREYISFECPQPMGRSSTNALNPEPALIVKLGSLIVHYQELTGPRPSELDKVAIDSLLGDPDVTEWFDAMNKLALLPLKRGA